MTTSDMRSGNQETEQGHHDPRSSFDGRWCGHWELEVGCRGPKCQDLKHNFRGLGHERGPSPKRGGLGLALMYSSLLQVDQSWGIGVMDMSTGVSSSASMDSGSSGRILGHALMNSSLPFVDLTLLSRALELAFGLFCPNKAFFIQKSKCNNILKNDLRFFKVKIVFLNLNFGFSLTGQTFPID